jgi:hypothetical protein
VSLNSEVVVHKIPAVELEMDDAVIPVALFSPPKDMRLKRVRAVCKANGGVYAEVGGTSGDSAETVNAGFEVILGRIDDLEENETSINLARFDGDWYFVGYYAN